MIAYVEPILIDRLATPNPLHKRELYTHVHTSTSSSTSSHIHIESRIYLLWEEHRAGREGWLEGWCRA